MKNSRPISLLIFLALLAASCIPDPSQVATPTLPQATLAPPTVEASAVVPTAVIPTEVVSTAIVSTEVVPTTVDPTPIVLTATTAPTTADTSMPPTSEPTPEGPPEAIAILQPGPGSRITSPIMVTGMADPTFEQSLVVELILADGTALVTTPTQIGADVGQRGPFLAEIEFTTAVEQQAFLQVYAISAKDGGVTHLSSVGVTLLPGGAAEIRPALEDPEQIRIDQPAPGDVVSGGVLHVQGFGVASFEQTLVIDLLDENGAVLVTTPVTVSSPEMGQPGPFSADIPYTVSGENSGRLQVRDVSPAHGGSSHLSSVEIRLTP